MRKICITCKLEFETSIPQKKSCSADCRKIYLKKWNQEKNAEKSKQIIIPCKICGTEFKRFNSRRYCCSKECSAMLNKICRSSAEFKERRKITLKKYNNSEKGKKNLNSWLEKNWDHYIKKQTKNQTVRRKIDPEFRLRGILRSAIARIFGGVFKKTISRKDVVFYTEKQLREHLEKQFRNGMSWENYGITGWHVDHIKALSEFQFFNEKGELQIEQVRACMALENLQPLWCDENIRKGGIKKIRLIR